MYSGTSYTIVPDSDWPVALGPMVVTAQAVEPMYPKSPAAIQFNFSGDNKWTQFVLFMNADGQLLPSGNAQTQPDQVGWTISQNQIVPQYQEIRLPNGTAGVMTVYQPQGKTIVADSPISDPMGNPILVSDFMSGRYMASLLIDPTDVTAALRILDVQNPNPVSGLPTQVWSSGTPFPIGDLPKNVQSELVGIYLAPPADGSITFTAGRFRSTFYSSGSTVQSGPNQGQQIQPVRLKAVVGNPSYTDPVSGWVYAYNPETGELARNFTSLPPADLSNPFAPFTTVQIDAVPQS